MKASDHDNPVDIELIKSIIFNLESLRCYFKIFENLRIKNRKKRKILYCSFLLCNEVIFEDKNVNQKRVKNKGSKNKKLVLI